MFYSKTTGGFYTREIHGNNIPADAVEITKNQHLILLQGQSEGKMISSDEKGRPILIDRPKLTADEISLVEKAKAKQYLNETDWYLTRKIETGKDVPEEISNKRAEARTLLQG